MLSTLMKRWLYRPKRSDTRPLARFYFADEDVTRVTAELNAVDLRKEPQKYLVLLNQLRQSQDHMLRSIELVMEDFIAGQRQSRDYHVKFPDEIRHENLGVQLWFAAECLSAGSFLEVEEAEGLLLRPLAEQLLHCLLEVRQQLRKQSLSDFHGCSAVLRDALLRYDGVFSQFELSYISTVIPVKSAEELQRQQEIVVLFCETVDRALKLGYLNQELIDDYEPLVMFTIPRLAIICGLLIFPDGPLNLQNGAESMCSLFSPFYTLLQKIRDLLQVLSEEELCILEMSLCAAESSGFLCSPPHSDKGRHIAPAKPGDGEKPRHRQCSGPRVRPGSFCPSHSPSFPISAFSVCVPLNQEVDSDPRLASVAPGSQGERLPQPGSLLLEQGQLQYHPVQSECDTPSALCSSTQSQTYVSGCATRLPSPVREQFDYRYPAAEPSHVNVNVNAEARETQRRLRQSLTRQSWNSWEPLPSSTSQHPRRDGRRVGSGQQSAWKSGGGDLGRMDLRARYSSSSDMVHRLFVCISGVADQLQTNFASDMRAILKCVFELIVSRKDAAGDDIREKLTVEEKTGEELEDCELCMDMNNGSRMTNIRGPPTWVPDSACTRCTGCNVPFSLLRRRHHCRSCGKIFCARCSPNEAPLPRFCQMTPVRVCNHCFNCHTVGETTPL